MAVPTTRPLRFLFATPFYPAYLGDFYSANPALVEADYATQMDALLDDGFGGVHLLTREVAKLGWHTMQIVTNSAPSQRRWLKENELHLAEPIDMQLLTAMQIQMFQPDVFYTTDVTGFDTKFLRRIPTKPKLVIGWRGFPIPQGTDLSGYDVIATNFDKIKEDAPRFGAHDVQHHTPGAPVNGIGDEPEEYDRDVIFSGSVTNLHVSRVQMLIKIWQASLGADGGTPFDFGLFMPDVSMFPPAMQAINQGSLWGKAMLRALKRSRVTINIALDGLDQPPNMRVIESTGVGAFLLTNHHPDLGNFFKPGEELETFRDPDDLIVKIRESLANDTKRRAIARAGYARCMRDHSLPQTARKFHDMVLRKLAAV